jgi:hypothetical protein
LNLPLRFENRTDEPSEEIAVCESVISKSRVLVGPVF